MICQTLVRFGVSGTARLCFLLGAAFDPTEAIGEERRLLVRGNLCELDSPVEVDDCFDRPAVAAADADASAPSTSLSHYSKYIEDLSLKR